MIARISVYVVFILAFGANLYSSDETLTSHGADFSPHRFGAYFGLGYNMHFPSFSDLPGVPNCCPQFQNGEGFGLNFGIVYEHRFDDKFSFLTKAAYFDDSGLLTRIENEVLSVDFQPYDGKFEHSIDASLSSIAVKPMLGYYLIDSYKNKDYNFLSSLALFAGFRLGFLTTKDYSQKEQVIEPSDRGRFIDTDSQIRNESSGELPNANGINFAIATAIRSEFPLNQQKNFSLFFELGYDHQLTNIVDDRDWTKSSILANIGVIYTPIKYEERIIEFDSITPLPGASLRAVGVINGKEVPKATLQIEEYLSEKIQPLLNYIFFSHSDDSLPERYKLLDTIKAKEFTIESLYNHSTLDNYYNILNIIGKRMQLHPNSNITLTGCNSGMGFEKNNSDLSRQRARNVANYLSDVWQINSNRIKIVVRNLPEKPSNVNKDDGIAENRRVEIDSDLWDIIAPIITYDTIRTATPPIIRFYPENKGIDKADKWVINCYQQRMVQKSIFGDTPVPEKVDWNIDEDKKNMPKFDTPLYITFQLIGKQGNELVSADTELPLEQITIAKKQESRTLDKKLDRFSLILFDFDSANIYGNNSRIASIINSKLLGSNNISIIGYTDRMGDESYNLKLSMDRAQALAKVLDIKPDRIDGLGKTIELYDNNLPEGRFYSRTVEIIAETPVQW
jgi:outer membrane protein OmpA-like peptidoglycan-associated protein